MSIDEIVTLAIVFWLAVALFVALHLARHCAEQNDPEGLDSGIMYAVLWPISFLAYWRYTKVRARLEEQSND